MTRTSTLVLAIALGTSPLLAHVDMTHITQSHHMDHMMYEVEVDRTPMGDVREIREIKVSQTTDQVQIGETEVVVVIEEDDDDPIEGYNRVVFEINDFFYGLLFTPIAKIYRGIFPDEVRTRVNYVLRNLWEPVNFGNSLLQGDFEEAGTAIGRLVVNSTVGVGGVFDVGEDWGMPYQRRDFGMTLASWGVGDGGYFVLPLIGPSTFRDGPSIAADIAMDPLTWILPHTDVDYLSYVRGGTEYLDEYQSVMPHIEDLRETSIDFYASVRSWYLEKRRANVRKALGEVAQEVDAPKPLDME